MFLLAAVCYGGMSLLGCRREPDVSVARWVHCRALEDTETNGVCIVMSADAHAARNANARTEMKMSTAERDESTPRMANVLSELEMFTTPERTKVLVDEFTAVCGQLGYGRKEALSAFESVRYFVALGVVPLITAEIRSQNAEIALAAMEFWAVEFQKAVNDSYMHKYELTVKWVESECKKAENSGCRDVGAIRQYYMKGLKDMPRTLRQLRFYTIEPPHIVK